MGGWSDTLVGWGCYHRMTSQSVHSAAALSRSLRCRRTPPLQLRQITYHTQTQALNTVLTLYFVQKVRLGSIEFKCFRCFRPEYCRCGKSHYSNVLNSSFGQKSQLLQKVIIFTNKLGCRLHLRA